MTLKTKQIKTKTIKPLEDRPYDPKEVEADWYEAWEGMGAFKPEYDGPAESVPENRGAALFHRPTSPTSFTWGTGWISHCRIS